MFFDDDKYRDRLDDQQIRFALEYCKDYNAQRAHAAAGYAATTRHAHPYRLLKIPAIKELIAEYHEQYVSKTRILGELTKIALSDIVDYVTVDEDTGEVKVKPLSSMPAGSTKAIRKLREKRRILSTDSVDTILDSNLEFELHDKMEALKILAKHTGLVSDTMTVNGTVETKDTSILDKLPLDKRMEFLALLEKANESSND